MQNLNNLSKMSTSKAPNSTTWWTFSWIKGSMRKRRSSKIQCPDKETCPLPFPLSMEGIDQSVYKCILLLLRSLARKTWKHRKQQFQANTFWMDFVQCCAQSFDIILRWSTQRSSRWGTNKNGYSLGWGLVLAYLETTLGTLGEYLATPLGLREF